MKGLIIAAGKGTRLAEMGDSKPLVRFLGIPLIEHVIHTARAGGIREFNIVIGYNGEMIKNHLVPFAERNGIRIQFIFNPDWEEPNGISVLAAEKHLAEPFVLMMSDHLFDPEIVRELIADGIDEGEVKLAIDKRIKDNPLIDIDDVTKVQESNGHIIEIGKHLIDYNAFDTGIFLCTPGIFDGLNRSITQGEKSLSGGIKALGEMDRSKTFDIGNRNWLDVDDRNAFYKAEQVFKNLIKN